MIDHYLSSRLRHRAPLFLYSSIRILVFLLLVPLLNAKDTVELPPLKDYGLMDYDYTSKKLPHSEDQPWTLVGRLPYNAQFVPWIKLESRNGEEVVTFDSTNPLVFCQQKAQSYTTRKGEQIHEVEKWISGEGAIYRIPAGVKVLEVKFRETGYNTEFTGSFRSNDADYNRLWEKATRTCYLCMRDHFMDCPDRERSEWLGDAVLQMEECFYAFDLKSHAICKKFVRSGQVNGLPGQNLIAHGEYGNWGYYLYTADLDSLKHVYPVMKAYLDRYEFGPEGLKMIKRPHSWLWFDWGEGHQDKPVIWLAQYYSAISALKKAAQVTGNEQDIPAIEQQQKAIREYFDRSYWKEDGYRSGAKLDERANAMAVCAGLADESKWPVIAEILQVKNYEMKDGKLDVTIHQARYEDAGDPAKSADVAARIQKIVDAGETEFVVSNEAMGGDPSPGKEKVLKLDYTISGEQKTLEVKARAKVDFLDQGASGLCGPYFERWVLEAQCLMGREEDALIRMYQRYKAQIAANISTLYEYMIRARKDEQGIHSIYYTTLNHGWNVPNTILSKFIAGVAPVTPGWETYHVLPQEAFLQSIDVSITTVKGQLDVAIAKSGSDYRIGLQSPEGTTAIVGIPKKSFQRLDSISANGQIIWQGKATGKVPGLSFHGDQEGYVQFKVRPGKWDFTAKGKLDLSSPKQPSQLSQPAHKLNKQSWTVSASIDNQEYKVGPWGKNNYNVIQANSASAVDGDSWTGWRTMQAQQPGQWFAIDMGQAQRFSSIQLDNTWAIYDGPAEYAVYVSNDTGDWGKPVATGKGDPTGITVIKCGEQNARHIKIVQQGEKDHYWSIFEVDVCP